MIEPSVFKDQRGFFMESWSQRTFEEAGPDAAVDLRPASAAYKKWVAEGGIRWNDPDMAVDWGVRTPALSKKDQALPWFRDAETGF